MRPLVMSYIRAWIANPQRAAEPQLATSAQLRERLATATTRKRWVSYADSISPRITADPQWGTLAQLLDQALEAHLDVDGLVSIALEQGPLDPNMPARDLTQRVTSLTNPEPDLHDESAVKPPEDSVPSYPDLHPGGPRP